MKDINNKGNWLRYMGTLYTNLVIFCKSQSVLQNIVYSKEKEEYEYLWQNVKK